VKWGRSREQGGKSKSVITMEADNEQEVLLKSLSLKAGCEDR
jgi:hypothetical protein